MSSKFEFGLYGDFDLLKVFQSEIWHNYEKKTNSPFLLSFAVSELGLFNAWANQGFLLKQGHPSPLGSFDTHDYFYLPDMKLPTKYFYKYYYNPPWNEHGALYLMRLSSPYRYTFSGFNSGFIAWDTVGLFVDLGFDVFITICKSAENSENGKYSWVDCIIDKYTKKDFELYSENKDILSHTFSVAFPS
jgi:hypothetical protein